MLILAKTKIVWTCTEERRRVCGEKDAANEDPQQEKEEKAKEAFLACSEGGYGRNSSDSGRCRRPVKVEEEETLWRSIIGWAKGNEQDSFRQSHIYSNKSDKKVYMDISPSKTNCLSLLPLFAWLNTITFLLLVYILNYLYGLSFCVEWGGSRANYKF